MTPPEDAAPPADPTGKLRKRSVILAAAGSALLSALLVALLTTIFQHKQEAKNPYIRFVNVTEETTDPAPWGVNWPREYDTYKRTSERSRTRFGGHGGSEAMPVLFRRCFPSGKTADS